jgi:hypothetical protein
VKFWNRVGHGFMLNKATLREHEVIESPGVF